MELTFVDLVRVLRVYFLKICHASAHGRKKNLPQTNWVMLLVTRKLRQKHCSDLGAPEDYKCYQHIHQDGKKKYWMSFKTSWNSVNVDHGAVPNSLMCFLLGLTGQSSGVFREHCFTGFNESSSLSVCHMPHNQTPLNILGGSSCFWKFLLLIC